MGSDSKKPWQSKTVVVNAVLALASVAALFLPAASAVPVWMAAHVAEIGMGWGVLNIILRAITKDAISLGD